MTTFNDRARDLLEEAEKEWASQGRTEEQKWAVRNFMTGTIVKALAALNKAHEEECLRVIGEDVKDYGRLVVRNDDGSEHSSSAGSYRDYCNNELRAEQRNRLKPTEDNHE